MTYTKDILMFDLFLLFTTMNDLLKNLVQSRTEKKIKHLVTLASNII